MIKKLLCIIAFIFIALPLFPQHVVELEEVLRFSDVPEKEIFFKRPSEIKLDDKGNIYISDRPHILKFGFDGKFLVKMIKLGQGPGELQDSFVGNLNDFFIVKNKVIAFSSKKVLWFNEQGEFQEEKRLPIKSRADFIVTPDLNYYALGRKVFRKNEMPSAGPFKIPLFLWRISPDFKEKEVIYTWELMGNINKEKGTFSLGWYFHTLVDSEILIVNLTKEYEFLSFDLKKGKIIKTFTRKYKRIKIKNKKGTSYMPGIRGFHYVRPELWVVTYTQDENKNPLIHSYDLKTGDVEEFYLKCPKSESDISRRYNWDFFAVANGFIFMIEQNSEGLYNIVKYRMKRVKVSRAVATY
jgi:hypothetical protein